MGIGLNLLVCGGARLSCQLNSRSDKPTEIIVARVLRAKRVLEKGKLKFIRGGHGLS